MSPVSLGLTSQGWGRFFSFHGDGVGCPSEWPVGSMNGPQVKVFTEAILLADHAT